MNNHSRTLAARLFAAALLLASVVSALAGVHCVDVNSTNATPPYTNWTTAATNIQDAVDAAAPGDEIVVTNGIYATGGARNGFGGNRVAVDKPLSVRSVNGPQFTTIDGAGMRCVYLNTNATLSGFTLTNGTAEYCEGGGGGGAYGGTLNNCILSGNSSATGCRGGSRFGGGFGGGASCSTLNNCILVGNDAGYGGSGGGAAECVLNNCTLTGNRTYGGVNGSARGGGAFHCTLNNCILYFNTYFNDAFSPGSNYADCTLNYCCTTPQPTNGIDNITNTPLFVDQASGNLRLQSNSPCINAGQNVFAPAGPDLDGNPRIMGDTVDIGAYEFPLQPQLTITFSSTSAILAWPTNYAGVFIMPDHYEAYFYIPPRTLFHGWSGVSFI